MKSINQAHLENGTFEQIVTHLEMEVELNGLVAPDELHKNGVSQHATNTNTDRPKLTCHQCEKPSNLKNQCRSLKKQREQAERAEDIPGNKNTRVNDSNPNINDNNIKNRKNNKNSDRAERKLKTVYPLCHTCGNANQCTENWYFVAHRPPPGHRGLEGQNRVQERANQNDSNETTQAAAQSLD